MTGYDVECYTRTMRYKYKKFYDWDSNISYITGLMAADGCLINDNRHLNITSKDIEIINNVKNILNLDVKVSTKTSSYGGEAYNLQFGNVALYDFMINVGLTPAKSLTMGRLKIPDQYYPDFLRGYFDGDGSFSGFWDTRWKNSLTYSTSFSSGSLNFLVWLKDHNRKLLGINKGSINPGVRAFNLRYSKRDSETIFKYMYYQESVPKLTRKYDKFIVFFSIDPYAKKDITLARVL